MERSLREPMEMSYSQRGKERERDASEKGMAFKYHSGRLRASVNRTKHTHTRDRFSNGAIEGEILKIGV
jgi:hypothetical protein